MKRIILATLLFVAAQGAIAQNTFPSSGNVGIGTTSPNFKLHINSSDNQLMRFTSTNGTWLDFESTNAAVGSRIWSIGHVGTWNKFGIYQRDGTNQYRFLIDQNGNVGIGTTSPYSILEVSPTATSWGEGIVVNPASNNYGAIFFRQTEGTYNGSWFVGKISTNNFGVLRQGLTGMTGTSRAESTFEINHTNGNALFGGNVGIGTTSPLKPLHVNSGTVNAGIRVESADSDAIIEFVDNSSSASGGAYIGARGDNIIVGQLADIRMSINADGNVGIGTADPKSKLAVDGVIRATKVQVMADVNSVPDYVFEEDYELRTLQETKVYIEANKHLPEIPSAAEIGKDGIDLGDMNMRLLKKIEELTLYQIQLMEEMTKMKKGLEEMKKVSSK